MLNIQMLNTRREDYEQEESPQRLEEHHFNNSHVTVLIDMTEPSEQVHDFQRPQLEQNVYEEPTSRTKWVSRFGPIFRRIAALP